MSTRNSKGELCDDLGKPYLAWGPPIKSLEKREQESRERVARAMRERRGRNRIGERREIRPLEESFAAVDRHLADGAGAWEEEPKCATCHDTGWQELPAGGMFRRCWKGCDIPRKATESMGEVYRGPSGPKTFE